MNLFDDNLEEICAATIDKFDLIRQGDTVTVALSGGADSVALLHFLSALAPRRGFLLKAAHLNHSLRGDESDRDENFVRELCQKLGIELAVKRADIRSAAKTAKISIEECARKIRYDFLADAAPDGKIATAHTLNDSAETVLLNLARGTSLRGLAGIPHRRGNIIRPLLACTRPQIEDYCLRHSLNFVTDSSNFSDLYTRNKLRHYVLPVLQEISPNFLATLSGNLDLITQDADYLDSLAQTALDNARISQSEISLPPLQNLPLPISSRALRILLDERGISVSRKRIALLSRLLTQNGCIQLSHRWILRSENDKLRFAETSQPQNFSIPDILIKKDALPVELLLFPHKKIVITPAKCKGFENIRENYLKNLLDYDKINFDFIIRSRRPGDKICTPGRGVTKSLKNLCNEAKIPLLDRQKMAVIARDNEIVWSEYFGAAQGYCACAETRNILIIQLFHTV